MDNRRTMSDPHLEQIKERLDAHSKIIESNADKIDTMSLLLKDHVNNEDSVLNGIKEDLAPWKEAASGIAMVGRWGDGLKTFGLWVAGIIAAIVTISTAFGISWEWLQHFRMKQ